MAQANSLWNMFRARSPNQGVLECVLHSPVDVITYIFYRAVVSHYQCFAEIWIDASSICLSAGRTHKSINLSYRFV